MIVERRLTGSHLSDCDLPFASKRGRHAFEISADLGSGPRDSIMLLIVDKTGWSLQWVRIGMEVLVLILGWALGGPVGVGSMIIAFFLGGVSVQVWLNGPTAPLEHAHAERTGQERNDHEKEIIVS